MPDDDKNVIDFTTRKVERLERQKTPLSKSSAKKDNNDEKRQAALAVIRSMLDEADAVAEKLKVHEFIAYYSALLLMMLVLLAIVLFNIFSG